MDGSSSVLPASIIWNSGQPDVELVSSSSSSPIIGDMRRLLRNPAHLHSVRHAAIRRIGVLQQQLGPGLAAKPLTVEQKFAFMTHIMEANLPASISAALSQNDEGQLAGAIAILLSRLPSLDTLEIQTFDRTDDDEWTRSRPPGDPVVLLLGQLILSDSSASFPNVTVVKVLAPSLEEDPDGEFKYYVYADTVLSFFYLPRIRTLELHRVEDGGQPINWPVLGSTPSATNLEELVLSKVQLSEANVNQLLQASPNLKVLRWEHVIDAEYAGSWLNLASLQASLETLKGSLEDFSFSLILWTSTAIDCGEPGPWGIRGALASLMSFERLRRLVVSLPVLLGWESKNSPRLDEVLPTGIQRLTITNEMFYWWHYRWDDLDWEGDGLNVPRWRSIEAKILEYLEGRPPNLEELRLELSTTGEDLRAQEVRNKLVSAGEACGINVTVELKP
ncbi:hypothetical protein LY78DRAFT_664658 [Colletotrichum sublineola]|nr:hypothetical protein LY78DRAFT_664658 [Colletotrichum sublineola]